ncbi:MAG: hypothetical protein DCF25_14255 [Leptolyngbya foveolarum]|uniref:DUF4278 domain-containing protein n=1 Tax=Leptolyngbya foveolarum TaxID=47253 RepID=A0A2W4VZ00_9CYAN|nr:MAG: hypothetical protein DCF25_14255 [Leptolyngbya foveolarum]
MKLTYRGVDYDYNPPMLEVTESEVACQYRGQPATVRYVQHVPIPQPAEQLTYRGVAYQTTRQGQLLQLAGQPAQVKATARKANALQGLRKLAGNSTAAKARRDLLNEASLTHMQSISRSLQHRIEVATAEGNESLLRQLESEMRQTV